MKRWRCPKAKQGELKAQYGKLRYCDPDILYVGGGMTSNSDRRMLHNVFSGPTHLSLYGELEARGYDLTTFKFSIQKKLPKE